MLNNNNKDKAGGKANSNKARFILISWHAGATTHKNSEVESHVC